MAVNIDVYKRIKLYLDSKQVTLVAVSKFKPIDDIQVLYDLGQRDFGENFVQELLIKYEALPKDIRWHFIGHLQSNKVKYIAPFIHLIHGVDSEKLLAEINKQAAKLDKKNHCLLQLFIADEATKYGLDENELQNIDLSKYPNIILDGLMGMASFTDDQQKIKNEFSILKSMYDHLKPSIFNLQPSILSMGMSGDYKIAIAEGSNMVRIGSLLFGARDKNIQ